MSERALAGPQQTKDKAPAQASGLAPQRTCACGGAAGLDGECQTCRSKRLSLRRSALDARTPVQAPPIVHDVLRSPGQPLDAATRAFMEPRFGHDFSQVRVHTDAQAAASARAVGAQAYSAGQNMVFGDGHYAPATSTGQKLLAHELAHVVQSAGQIPAEPRLAFGEDRWEYDAKLAERVVVGNRPHTGATGAPPAVRLSPDPNLEDTLERIRLAGETSGSVSTSQKVIRILDAIRGINRANLTESDNLEPILLAIRQHFSGPDQWEVIRQFKERVGAPDHLQTYRAPGEEKESPGFWGTIGGGLMGEWNKDPTYAMIGVDTVVSLIPIADQICDIRDLSAHLSFMIVDEEYKRPMRWVAAAFSLISLFPEIGSAIKGASKFLIKGAARHIDEALQVVRHFLPTVEDLGHFRRMISTNWAAGVARSIEEWNKLLNWADTIISRIPAQLSERRRQLTEALTRIRELAPERLRVAFAEIRQLWDEFLASFNFEPHFAVEGVGGLSGNAVFSQSAKQEEKATHIWSTKVEDLKPSAPPLETQAPLGHLSDDIPEYAGPPGPPKRPPLQHPPATGHGAAAREQFDNLRDSYAQRLGVGPGGQVHHAIELQVLDRYPGVFTQAELNGFANMRGIPIEDIGRRQLHGSKIREIFDRHYHLINQEITKSGLKPGTSAYNSYVRRHLEDARDEIDELLGQFFSEYRTGRPRSFR